MSVYKDISYNLKKQNVSLLEKSAAQNSTQSSEEQKSMHKSDVSTAMLDKGHQENREKIAFPREKRLDLINTFYEFCVKPNASQLETSRNRQKFYKGNNTSRTGEGKQVTPLRIINNQCNTIEANLPNAIDDKSVDACEESTKLVEKNHQDDTQMVKCTEDKKGPKKRKHEEGEIDIPMSEESTAARKNIRLKNEKEFFMGNPLFEFLLKSENSKPHLYVNENPKELYTDDIAPGREKKMEKKDKARDKKGADILGNHLTDKDRNKLKVVCPHCSKKVSAPGFTRHLSYCMRGSARKSTRRS